MYLLFNPSLQLTFSFFWRPCRRLKTPAVVANRSTSRKQTSKGLFICTSNLDSRKFISFSAPFFFCRRRKNWEMNIKRTFQFRIAGLRITDFNSQSAISQSAIGLRFNLNFNTTWQIQLWKRIYSAGRRSINIQQALMRSQLELLTTFLVHVGRTQHGKNLFAGRKRNRPCYYGACAANSFNDLLRWFVHQVVIVWL